MNTRGVRAGVLLSAAVACLAASSVSAHLAVIRQELESGDTIEPGDRLGRSLVSGDFNGDGYDDLAMGAPEESEDVIDVKLHGGVCINYGTPFGLTHLTPTFITIGAVVDNVVRYGRSLAAGDFDNDGYDDLAVGAPYLDDDINLVVDAGAVYIFRGGALGLEVTPEVTLFEGTMGGPPTAGGLFGFSLAAGDFNNDSYDDLAVGAVGLNSDAGQVFWYFFTDNAGLQVLDQGTLEQLDFGYSNEPGSRFGWSLAAAPFDTLDGDDLAVGTPQRTGADLVTSGAVYVTSGTATGFAPAAGVFLNRQDLGLPHDPGDLFGFALAAGTFRPNLGPHELAIGEPGATVGGDASAGRVTVLEDLFGTAQDVSFTQFTGGLGSTPDPGDEFGFALAAGDFDNSGWDDLAVGSPFEDVVWQGATYGAAGLVHLFPGGVIFAAGTNGTIYTARNLNDAILSGSQLGRALAFGRFDSSDSANLAIGAPDREFTDYNFGNDIPDAGQVHILAPHRQITNRQNRASLGVDCTGNIIYSQAMFQQMPMASITKIMTVLLACEAIDDVGDTLTENTVYTVPKWLAEDMPYGSLYGVLEGEKLTLQQLMALTMAISANDCAWAIGDLVTGADNVWDDNEDWDTNIVTVLSGFANRMNIKAMDIGMSRTTYKQPAGSNPGGTAWTCAYDQYLLAKEAMQNARFREIADTIDWSFMRDAPGASADTLVEFSNGFMMGMKSAYATCDGLKPGGSPVARKTGVVSAPIGTLRIYATSLGVIDTDYGDPVTDSSQNTLRDLLRLVDDVCDSVNGWPGEPPPGPPRPPLLSRSGVSTHKDSSTTEAKVEYVPYLGDVILECRAQTGDPCAEVTIARTGEAALAPGDTATYCFEALDGHLGFCIQNRDSLAAELTLELSHPPSTVLNVVLPQDSTLVVAPYAGPPPLGEPEKFTMRILNASTANGALLDVVEKGYVYEGPVAGFARVLNRKLGTITMRVAGCDTVAGGSVWMVIRDASEVAVGVPPGNDPVRPGLPPLVHRSAPNPFAAHTEIRFETLRPGPVSVAVYDVNGRLVRRLAAEAALPAGSHAVTWDGRDRHGARAASGVYLYLLKAGTQQGSGKLLLID